MNNNVIILEKISFFRRFKERMPSPASPRKKLCEKNICQIYSLREASETRESVQRLLCVEILFAGFFSLFPIYCLGFLVGWWISLQTSLMQFFSPSLLFWHHKVTPDLADSPFPFLNRAESFIASSRNRENK